MEDTMQRWGILTVALLLALASVPLLQAQPKQTATTLKPCAEGYLDVNGIRLYHQIYGEGEPLVLLHGGLTTIEEQAIWIETLAKARKVIALELQGHGRSPDTERPISLETFGDDVAAVVDALGLERADLVGHSLGADAAIRAAIQHPEKVQRLVVISTAYAKRGWYPETQEGMASVGAEMADSVRQTPTGKLSEQWPNPERFPLFLDKMGEMMGKDYDWSEEIEKLPMPVLLVFADHDAMPQQHIAEFFALLGGGISEPGWVDTKLTNARLAVIPGYSHYNFISSPEVPLVVAKYLADPLTHNGSGDSAASTPAGDP
jgi:pimeloyl-ACP methyl ester carboxylesterase